MNKVIVLLALFCFTIAIHAQKTDHKLQAKVEELIKGFNGEIGIYIKDLNKNRIVSINADTVFPTASIVKVPILIGVMDKIRKGELHYHQDLRYRDSLLYAGVDLLGSFKDTEKIQLSKVMMLMLSMSDNTASLWLQSLAGTGSRINALMDSIGLIHTRINSRTPGREDYRRKYGWGQTTPAEMGILFEKIYKGEIFSRGVCDRMLRLLNRNYFDHTAISQLPPYATVFTKTGAVDGSRNEAMIVKGDKSLYVLCVFTKNNKDTTWLHSNEAWELTRKLSALLWKYFEPDDNWKPAPDEKLFLSSTE